jgi:hypothetical protein
MMALFGTDQWCRNGEVFSVYFGMFSQLGSFAVEEGRLGRRRPFAAAARWASVPGSAAVVIASIATTSFDGASEGAFKGAIECSLSNARPSAGPALRLTDTIFMRSLRRRRLVYLLGCGGWRPSPAHRRAKLAASPTRCIPIAFA